MAKKVESYLYFGVQIAFAATVMLYMYTEYGRSISRSVMSKTTVITDNYFNVMARDISCKQEYGIDYIFHDESESCKKCEEICDSSASENNKLSNACISRCESYISKKKTLAEIAKLLDEFRETIKSHVPPVQENKNDEHVLSKLKEIDEHSIKLQGIEEIRQKIEEASKLIQEEKDSRRDELTKKLQKSVSAIELNEYIVFMGLIVACSVTAMLLILLYFGIPCLERNEHKFSKTKAV
ncbi:uncharacterized protein LOC144430807 isoform X2 [Styela clava]